MDITESSDNSLIESSRSESYQSANLNDAFIVASMEHISCDVTDEFQNTDDHSGVDELRELNSSSDTKYNLSDSTSYYQLPDRTKPANMVNVRNDSTELCEQQISNNASGLSNIQHDSSSQERPKETRLSILLRDMLDKTLRRNCNTLETSTQTPIVPTNIVSPDTFKHDSFSSEESQTEFSLLPKQETWIKPITNGKSDISHSQNYCTTIFEHSNETTSNQLMDPSSNWSRMFLTKMGDKKSCKKNESEIYAEEDYSTDLTASDDIVDVTRQESSLCSDLSFESTSSFNDAFLSASEVSFERRLQSTDQNETCNDTTTTNNSISVNSLKNNSPATSLVTPEIHRMKFTDLNKKCKVRKRRSRSVSDADEIFLISDLGENSISKNSTRRSSDDCVIKEPIMTVNQLILKFSNMPTDQENRPQSPLHVRRRQGPMLFVTPATPF